MTDSIEIVVMIPQWVLERLQPLLKDPAAFLTKRSEAWGNRAPAELVGDDYRARWQDVCEVIEEAMAFDYRGDAPATAIERMRAKAAARATIAEAQEDKPGSVHPDGSVCDD
jgi:hypothetical protein